MNPTATSAEGTTPIASPRLRFLGAALPAHLTDFLTDATSPERSSGSVGVAR